MFGPGRGASANPPKFCKFGGQAGRKADERGILSPRTFQARRGAFFALFAGSGSQRRISGGGRGQPDGEKTQNPFMRRRAGASNFPFLGGEKTQPDGGA